jgi:hypothetical protein
MSVTLRAEVVRLVNLVPATDVVNRAAVAIYFVSSSPDFAVQQ